MDGLREVVSHIEMAHPMRQPKCGRSPARLLRETTSKGDHHALSLLRRSAVSA